MFICEIIIYEKTKIYIHKVWFPLFLTEILHDPVLNTPPIDRNLQQLRKIHRLRETIIMKSDWNSYIRRLGY